MVMNSRSDAVRGYAALGNSDGVSDSQSSRTVCVSGQGVKISVSTVDS